MFNRTAQVLAYLDIVATFIISFERGFYRIRIICQEYRTPEKRGQTKHMQTVDPEDRPALFGIECCTFEWTIKFVYLRQVNTDKVMSLSLIHI